jgi:hypothetical protein
MAESGFDTIYDLRYIPSYTRCNIQQDNGSYEGIPLSTRLRQPKASLSSLCDGRMRFYSDGCSRFDQQRSLVSRRLNTDEEEIPGRLLSVILSADKAHRRHRQNIYRPSRMFPPFLETFSLRSGCPQGKVELDDEDAFPSLNESRPISSISSSLFLFPISPSISLRPSSASLLVFGIGLDVSYFSGLIWRSSRGYGWRKPVRYPGEIPGWFEQDRTGRSRYHEWSLENSRSRGWTY